MLSGQIPVPATGVYALHAQVDQTNGTRVAQSRSFEALALTNPDNCEVLNSASCMLPYPSDVFLAEDLTRPAGFNPRRIDVDASALPVVTGPPLDPTPYNVLDGFSPTAQILMHFPSRRGPRGRRTRRGCFRPALSRVPALRRHPHL